MELDIHSIPRAFSPLEGIQLKDMGDINLATDEQLTFVTDSGKPNDIVKKEWGFYLGNSINANLKGQNFKLALAISFASKPPRLYLNLVEMEKMDAFEKYLKDFNAKVVCWLDDWMDLNQYMRQHLYLSTEMYTKS